MANTDNVAEQGKPKISSAEKEPTLPTGHDVNHAIAKVMVIQSLLDYFHKIRQIPAIEEKKESYELLIDNAIFTADPEAIPFLDYFRSASQHKLIEIGESLTAGSNTAMIDVVDHLMRAEVVPMGKSEMTTLPDAIVDQLDKTHNTVIKMLSDDRKVWVNSFLATIDQRVIQTMQEFFESKTTPNLDLANRLKPIPLDTSSHENFVQSFNLYVLFTKSLLLLAFYHHISPAEINFRNTLATIQSSGLPENFWSPYITAGMAGLERYREPIPTSEVIAASQRDSKTPQPQELTNLYAEAERSMGVSEVSFTETARGLSNMKWQGQKNVVDQIDAAISCRDTYLTEAGIDQLCQMSAKKRIKEIAKLPQFLAEKIKICIESRPDRTFLTEIQDEFNQFIEKAPMAVEKNLKLIDSFINHYIPDASTFNINPETFVLDIFVPGEELTRLVREAIPEEGKMPAGIRTLLTYAEVAQDGQVSYKNARLFDVKNIIKTPPIPSWVTPELTALVDRYESQILRVMIPKDAILSLLAKLNQDPEIDMETDKSRSLRERLTGYPFRVSRDLLHDIWQSLPKDAVPAGFQSLIDKYPTRLPLEFHTQLLMQFIKNIAEADIPDLRKDHPVNKYDIIENMTIEIGTLVLDAKKTADSTLTPEKQQQEISTKQKLDSQIQEFIQRFAYLPRTRFYPEEKTRAEKALITAYQILFEETAHNAGIWNDLTPLKKVWETLT